MIELLAALALQTAPVTCLRPGDRVTGELRIVETKHPNGMDLKSHFVVIVQSRCVEEEGLGRVEGRWVQIAGEAAQQVRALPLGSIVVIEAQDWMVPQTAWHFGDFVALDGKMVGYELP
jgi:hypothetical protein